jgi:hypothetical protein
MQIHARYPILAFLLSITNINKRPDRSHHHLSARPGSDVVSLGPYGFVLVNTTGSDTWLKCLSIWAVHVLGFIGAAVVIWQAENIGKNAVVSWACPTDAYPLAWIVISMVHHLSAVIFMRLSFRKTANSASTKGQSAFWVWDLTTPGLGLIVANRKWARWSKAGNDLLNNANYLYGTAVFSSLTLVSGHTAIQKLAALGVIAFLSKGAAVWVLEGMEQEE